MKLRLTVPFHADETPMSWVSRLAARNGVKARKLCLDFGMSFQAVVDGVNGGFRIVLFNGQCGGRLRAMENHEAAVLFMGTGIVLVG